MKGNIYHANSEKNIRKLRPIFAFVPDALIIDGVLNEKKYTDGRWASINCGANKFAIGSQVFPDINSPASKEETKEFERELKKLIQKHKGKPSPVKIPGKPLE